MKQAAILALRLVLLAGLWLTVHAGPLSGTRIRQIHLGTAARPADAAYEKLKALLPLSPGRVFNLMDVRRSIDNLYRTGLFAQIEVRAEPLGDHLVDLFFDVQPKPVVRTVSCPRPPGMGRRELLNAVYSLRPGDAVDSNRLQQAQREALAFLRERGFFQASVRPLVLPDRDGRFVHLRLDIVFGRQAHVRRLTVNCPDPLLADRARRIFGSPATYVPRDHAARGDRLQRFLLQSRYLAATVRTREVFLDDARSTVDLVVDIVPGPHYVFVFRGMKRRYDLIARVWEKNVYEKWAEEESRARLLNYLKNKGHLDARIDCRVSDDDGIKTVVFHAHPGPRYRLRSVGMEGNRALSDEQVRAIVTADDQLFDRLFWLRLNTLVADLEVLKLYYTYRGFPDVAIQVQPQFQDRFADVTFRIDEGRAQTVAAVAFGGNRSFSAGDLLGRIRSRAGMAYVARQVSEDQKKLQDFYEDNGFEGTRVEVEANGEKDVALRFVVGEGIRRVMGDLVVIGASAMQRSLIRRLFPLHAGDPFSRRRLDAFQARLEERVVFADLRTDPVFQPDGTVDLIVRVIPDRSKFYGFGFGYEQRKDPRITLEYQDRNIFNSTSTFSGIVQAGFHAAFGHGLVFQIKERRFLLSLDTPFLFRRGVHSSLKVWEETEVYPSYQFNRRGLGFTLSRKVHDKLMLEGGVKWYRTNLTTLYDIDRSDPAAASLPQSGIDQLGKPFDTTVLALSLIHENRNDPFNPSSGDFLSADLKLGLPLLEKNNTFMKFFWNYQRHRRMLRNGTFSLSLKNGFGFGDMSITERFFAGGSHSFRGLRNDRLGPLIVRPRKASDTPGTNLLVPEGGNVLLLLNAELTFPSVLLPIEDLYYSLFFDWGNVFRKSSDFSLDKLERAIGVGLKYRTPMGPIRVEAAWNLRSSAEKNFLIQIGFGNVY